MAAVEVAELTSPVSENEPCGPDLDLASDSEFMNFMARAEGLLPVSFFSGPDGKPFDRSAIDLDAELAGAKPVLAQTRDIRLLVLLAKFCVLSRDIDAFMKFTSAIATLLERHWDEVHPRATNGDFGVRIATLETLDDSAPVIFPLQYAPLIATRRLGPIAYRQFMYAGGEAEPREGEESHDFATLEKAALETDLPNLLEARQQFENVQTAIAAIRKTCADRLGASGTPNLQKLHNLVSNIFQLLNGIVAKLDPSAAVSAPAAAETEAVPGAVAATSASPIKSRKQAAAALEAAAAYFARSEPSNPALLLLRQAQQLTGKSLVEVLKILMPAKLEEAKFLIGKDQALQISIEQLAQFARSSEEATQSDAVDGFTSTLADGDEAASAPIKAQSRQEVFAILEQIAAFYRNAEPSSPIAFIVERARGVADRDFLALVKELLAPPP